MGKSETEKKAERGKRREEKENPETEIRSMVEERLIH